MKLPKKYLTALFYSVQTPFAVWAGVRLEQGDLISGIALIAVMMTLEGVAVFFWIDAQSEQTVDGLQTRVALKGEKP